MLWLLFKIPKEWIVWWDLDEFQVQQQVEDYDSIGWVQSARGVAALLGLFCAAVTCVVEVRNKLETSSIFIDVGILLVLAILSGLGKRWAMIVAMIYYTVATFLEVIHPKENPHTLAYIVWWCIYMHGLYLAAAVEKQRAMSEA